MSSATTLAPTGSFVEVLRTSTGDSVTRGKLVRAGDKVTLSSKPAHLADRLEQHYLRWHAGRRVLVRSDQVVSFDLLPSWWLASVQLRPGEDRDDLCDDIPDRPTRNPTDPGHPEVRLPATLELTFPTSAGAGVTKVQLQSAPWWAEATVRLPGATIPRPLSLGRPGDWARLNKLWWAQASGPARCGSEDAPSAPYAVSAAGLTLSGDLGDQFDPGGVPDDPCAARAALVSWVASRVATMHRPRPSGPPPRPSGPPHRR